MIAVTRTSWRVAAVVVAVLAVAGCTGSDEPVDPPSTATAEPTGDAAGGEEWTVDELVDAVYASPEQEPIASVDGELAYQTVPAPARAEVLEVSASEASTTVLFRLTYLGEADLTVGSSYLSLERVTNPDVRGIALQVPAENRRLRPTLALEDAPTGEEPVCMCSRIPMAVSPDGAMVFTATFPALDPGTETVDLEIVGFPLLTGVPVDHA